MCLVFLYQVVLLVMLFGSEVNRSESLDSPIDFFRDVCVDQKFTNAFFLIEKKSFSGVWDTAWYTLEDEKYYHTIKTHTHNADSFAYANKILFYGRTVFCVVGANISFHLMMMYYFYPQMMRDGIVFLFCSFEQEAGAVCNSSLQVLGERYHPQWLLHVDDGRNTKHLEHCCRSSHTFHRILCFRHAKNCHINRAKSMIAFSRLSALSWWF